MALQRVIQSLKWKGLSEVWWLNREKNVPGASVTLSPNPELLQTGKQGSEPLLLLIPSSALFSIVFLFSFLSIFLLFFLFFSFSHFFLFSSFLLSFRSFYISSLFFFPFFFLFSFYHCFRREVLRSEPGEKVLIWSKVHHLCCNIWYLGPIKKSAGQAGHFHWMWLPQFGIITPASPIQCGLQALLHQHT